MKKNNNFSCAVRVLLLFFVCRDSSFSQLKSPVEPKIPEINFNNSPSEKKYSFNATIDLNGRKSLKARVFFPDDKLLIPVTGNYEKKSFVVQISSIKSIEFIEWEKKEYKKNSYMFYPSKTRVSLEGSYYICNRNIKELNKIIFINQEADRQEGTVYSIFYDYLKNKKWVNMKIGMETPVLRPFGDTITKIEFHREDQNYQEFLNIFKK